MYFNSTINYFTQVGSEIGHALKGNQLLYESRPLLICLCVVYEMLIIGFFRLICSGGSTNNKDTIREGTVFRRCSQNAGSPSLQPVVSVVLVSPKLEAVELSYVNFVYRPSFAIIL